MKLKELMVILLLGCVALLACGQQAEELPAAPPGYDWSVYEKIILSDDLLEISGIAFAPGRYDTIYAQQDEEGEIFKVGLPSGKYKRVNFGDGGDYEDIAIRADTLLLLESDGSFYGFKLDSLNEKKAKPFGYYEKILPGGEYEGLFADIVTGSYYALCKSCKSDKKNKQITIYELQWHNDSLLVTRNHVIPTAELTAAGGKKKAAFEPSALAKHPVTGDWYIVSSVNKMLAVVNQQWQVKATYPLSRKLLGQPEGIAFDNSGNMFISSEGDELQAGRILKFAYKKP
ncbi:SdiA-regulated domain-containing protein [Niabella sp. 22666]|uniref:SdiA-regulated domain-containing protein n=1 Tax=Niabella sp. 22666 TaxID=3453954 RepID=UPI003F832CAE